MHLYCDSLPNGNACYLDDMCKSGLCAGKNWMGTKEGVCADPRPAGAACSASGECSSGSCARPYSGAKADVCCKKKSVLSGWNGHYHCTDNATDGQACSTNSQCVSGYCHAPFLKEGQCESVKTVGEACTHDDQCAKGTDGKQVGTLAPPRAH